MIILSVKPEQPQLDEWLSRAET
jgi:hypothetical protein